MFSSDFFSSPIEFLKGVGPQRADLLKKEAGIFTFGDLLTYFPFRYVDRTRFYKIKEVNAELPYVQVRGKLVSIVSVGEKRSKRLVGKLQDETGVLELVWFAGIKWLKDSLQLNKEYIVFGRVTDFKGHLNMPHPEMETAEETDKQVATSLQAVYNTSEKLKSRGLDSRGILRLQKTLQQQLPAVTEVLSKDVLDALRLMPRHEAYVNIHLPESNEKLQKATFRLKFEEFFFLQMKLLINKVIRMEKFNGKKFEKVGDFFNEFYKVKLPFPLTEAQKRVIREIRNDCGSGKQMNRLLQGDVGSGKTVVALLSMLIAIDNGYQACLMAPTEILATQHGETITDLLKGMNVNVALLTGSTKKAQRKIIDEELQNGNIHILIGTHALIEDKVQFKNLGLAVVDEQHRFGVAQRAKLQLKSNSPSSVLNKGESRGEALSTHVLVMTATPIPRTLAMTLYGDLDVSVIDELPPGRKPIKTEHRTDSHRLAVWGFLKKQIAEGRQIYIVYPLIEESSKLDLKNLEEGYAAICHDFPMPEYKVSIVHGKMKPKDKEFEMQRFVKGETNIMVATTVIEVGVNVPNASVMIIESAERFGLSQLHQLRGRVGRGASQSYCILMTKDGLGKDSYQRIKTMCNTNDGFKIAEVDLELRGAGDIEGTQQSGDLDLKIANLSSDGSILQVARDAAMKILTEDPHLQKHENVMINKKLSVIMRGEFQWGRVG
ncbi:MAG: ATP-dependent DNA helicase RecG [Bacteroidota bacterium]